MTESLWGLRLVAAIAATFGLGGRSFAQQHSMYHKTVKVGGLDIVYREAGPKDAPAILRPRRGI